MGFHPDDPLGAPDAGDDLAAERDMAFIRPPALREHSDETWEGSLVGTHVLVGPTGSGKTYLSQVAGRVNGERRAAVLVAHAAPNTSVMVALDEMRAFAELPAVEFWCDVWRAACVFAHVNAAIRWHGELGEYHRELCRLLEGRALRPVAANRHPYVGLNALHEAAAKHAHGPPADYFRGDHWADILVECQTLVPEFPGTFLVLDHLDDSFSKAPRALFDAHAGILSLALTDDAEFDASIELCVSVRSATYAAASIGADRFRKAGGPRVLSLDWSRSDLLGLIERRCRPLEGLLLMPDSRSCFGKIIGIESIHTPSRGDEREGIDDYVLRHCTGTPRDVVGMGNTLLGLAVTCREQERPPSTDEVRGAVAARATEIGSEIVNQAITEFSVAHPESADHDPLGVRPAVAQLRMAIATLDSELVELGDLRSQLGAAFDLDDATPIVDALWRSRGFALESAAGWQYFSPPGGRTDVGAHVRDDVAVLLHSSLIDHAGLRPAPSPRTA